MGMTCELRTKGQFRENGCREFSAHMAHIQTLRWLGAACSDSGLNIFAARGSQYSTVTITLNQAFKQSRGEDSIGYSFKHMTRALVLF